MFAGQSQGIGKYYATFRVGVADLDAQTLARIDNVSRPVGVTGYRILHRRNQHQQADRQLLFHDELSQGQGVGRAAHVFFHRQHPGGVFQIQPAGIETDTFTNQGE